MDANESRVRSQILASLFVPSLSICSSRRGQVRPVQSQVRERNRPVWSYEDHL